MKRILLCSVLLGIAGQPHPHATACSTILAGQQASADGSVFMSHSCDGDVMGLEAIKEVHAMIKPAEQRYLELQPDLERAAVDVLRKRGPKAAEALLTAYASDCVTRVGSAYAELVDYLMLRFLVGDPELAHPTLPRIATPTLPQVEPRETR